MTGLSLHHASFPVSDLDRAVHFYGEVLGLERVDRPDLGFPGVWFRAGCGEIHLIVPPPGSDIGRPPDGLNPMAAHTALAVDDYTEALERIRAAGIEVLATGPEMGQMWIQDPDGNVIELIAPPRA